MQVLIKTTLVLLILDLKRRTVPYINLDDYYMQAGKSASKASSNTVISLKYCCTRAICQLIHLLIQQLCFCPVAKCSAALAPCRRHAAGRSFHILMSKPDKRDGYAERWHMTIPPHSFRRYRLVLHHGDQRGRNEAIFRPDLPDQRRLSWCRRP